MPPEVFRLHLQISGAVQGVGFRPFVYRLARELHLRGFVQNTSQGLNVQVEGPLPSLKELRRRVQEEAPAPARIAGLEARYLDPVGLGEFAIRPSTEGERRAHIL
ncbi:MAG TPA: acylphosphatase, partial [Acidobacteriota bacterium]|nr:acylphosphatase [Acidobacteriota bacterium]